MSYLHRYRPDTLPITLPRTGNMDRNGDMMRITRLIPTDTISVDQRHDAYCWPQERAGQALVAGVVGWGQPYEANTPVWGSTGLGAST